MYLRNLITKLICLFIIGFSLLVANIYAENGYINSEIVNAASQISTKELLEYESIAVLMSNQNDQSRFYSIIGIEIQRRIKELDKKFITKKLFYHNKINMFEEDLNLPRYLSRIPKVDLDDIIIKNTQLKFSDNYIDNKNSVQLIAKLYTEKLMKYRHSLTNHRNYFIALDGLYHCISQNEFKESLDIYNRLIDHLFD